MKRFSYLMMVGLLVVTGLLAGCDIPTEISSGLTTGASTIVGSLLTWAFQAASGNTTTSVMLDSVSSLVAMVL
jgi:hypothetical protein